MFPLFPCSDVEKRKAHAAIKQRFGVLAAKIYITQTNGENESKIYDTEGGLKQTMIYFHHYKLSHYL